MENLNKDGAKGVFFLSSDLKILKAFNGFALYKDNDLKIDFEKMTYNQNESILTAKDNINIYEQKKNFLIQRYYF